MPLEFEKQSCIRKIIKNYKKFTTLIIYISYANHMQKSISKYLVFICAFMNGFSQNVGFSKGIWGLYGNVQLQLIQESHPEFRARLEFMGEETATLLQTAQEVESWELEKVSSEILLSTLLNERKMFSGWRDVFHRLSSNERDVLFRGGENEGFQTNRLSLLNTIKNSVWPLAKTTNADHDFQDRIFSDIQHYPDLACMVAKKQTNSIKMTTLAVELLNRQIVSFMCDDRDVNWVVHYMTSQCLSNPEMYRQLFPKIRKSPQGDTLFQIYKILLRDQDSMSQHQMTDQKNPSPGKKLLPMYLNELQRRQQLPDARGLFFLLFETERLQMKEAHFLIKSFMLSDEFI